jgi:predicted AlkP superfamily phosphohydrolase/phosphomutase
LRKARAALAFALASALAVQIGCGSRHSGARGKQVIVIGVDGMDPTFVERHWEALPNLADLRQRGSFARLRTTTPPQSPVAWSTFITGLDPEVHGIFDFVERDPSTLAPFSSMSQTEEPRFQLSLGPYEIPLSRARVTSLRKGKAFWQTLSELGIPVTIVRMPTNYPPLSYGEALAGMGTPDLRGTQGTFSYYTDDPEESARSVDGGDIVKIALMNGRAELALQGPPNSLRKNRAASFAKLTVDVDPAQPAARLTIGGETALLKQNEWSDWIGAEFQLVPHLAAVHGMFRVFAKQLHPRFELYVSPVNADPLAPDLSISAPASFSRMVAREIGRYPTVGIPEDTAVLRQGVFDLAEFLTASHQVLGDERHLLDYSLRHFREGLLFFYFSSIDQSSHMLWGQHDAELLDVYRAVDASIGEVMRRVPSAELIVMSDHGFASFERAVNLNAWLRDRDLLAASADAKIDWPRTKAYALGLNGVYLNLAGREIHGVVKGGSDARATLEGIRQGLLGWRDPLNQRQVVESVETVDAAPSNARVAPDLIVGYGAGYRASWKTALGEVPQPEIEDNIDAWIADHCINAADVPGVLFTTRHLALPDPSLKDLTTSILKLFDVAPGQGMKGRNIY